MLLVAVVSAVVLVVTLEGQRNARPRGHAAELVGRVAGGRGCRWRGAYSLTLKWKHFFFCLPLSGAAPAEAPRATTYGTPARRSGPRSRCPCRTSRCCWCSGRWSSGTGWANSCALIGGKRKVPTYCKNQCESCINIYWYICIIHFIAALSSNNYIHMYIYAQYIYINIYISTIHLYLIHC